MKKILNGGGVFLSVILTVILSILVFLYAVILNVKLVVSEKGIANTLKKIDVVETLKSTENGTMWEDFKQLGETLNLSEEQFEQILNNDKVKEYVGNYIGEVLGSTLNDKEVKLTQEQIENFLNIAVTEYNKVSDVKISDSQKQEIVNSFDKEMIENINEEFSSINLTGLAPEYDSYIKLADNILFGDYTLFMLLIIVAIIALIALFRFSWYKWMPYVKTSTTISGTLMLIIGILLLVIPLNDMEIIMPIKNVLATNVFITAGVLFIISIALTLGKKYLKDHIKQHSENIKPVDTL